MSEPPQSIRGGRLLFSLDPAVGYLNHGSFGAVPLTVQRAQQRLRDEMAANPQQFFSRGLTDRLSHVRQFLAGAVGADPAGTALIPNATTGVGIALRTVVPGPGAEVVTTDHGYGAVDLAVDRICRDTGARHRKVAIPLSATDDEVVDTLTAAVHPDRTGMVIIDQVTSPTARLFPVNRIVPAIRARAPRVAILVDGAHAPGMLDRPAASAAADFWVGNLHKWAFAPPGTALLAVAPGWRSRVVPPVVSWQEDAGFPASVEYQGTIDYTPWLAAPAGDFLLRTLGSDAVRAHNAALVRWGQATVGAALDLAPAHLPDPGGPGAMRVVPLPGGAATDQAGAVRLRDRISELLRIEVAVTAWRGRGLLRLSAQVYNDPDEYRRLAGGLPGVLAAVARWPNRPGLRAPITP